MISKKAQMSNNALLVLIILFVSFVVLLAFFAKFGYILKDVTRDKGCLVAVLAKTLTSIEYGPFAYENEMVVNCPSYQITFGDKKVEFLRGGKDFEEKKYKNIPGEEISEKIHSVIADEMVHCWEKFGSGLLDVFKVPQDARAEIKDFFGGISDVAGCRICSEISFELSEDINLEGFKEYLQATKLRSKSKRDNSPGSRYYDYIAEKDRFCDEKYYSEVENCWEGYAEEKRINTDLNLSVSEDYLVVFIRQEMEQNKGTLNVYVMPSDTRNRVCQGTVPFR